MLCRKSEGTLRHLDFRHFQILDAYCINFLNLSVSAVIPVAAATMTPIPLLFGLIVLKIREFWINRSGGQYQLPIDQEDVKESESKQKLMLNGNGNIGEPNGHV